jgi:hypothetical protein
MNNIISLLKEISQILDSEDVRFEIAYLRDANNLEDEDEYINKLYDEVKSAIAELERSNNG